MKGKKAHSDVTVMVVPHGTGSVRKIAIRNSWIRAVAATVVLVLLGALYISWDYGQLRYYAPQLNSLRQEKEAQEERLEELSQQAEQLNQKAKQLDALEEEVRQLLQEVEPVGSGRSTDSRGGGSGWIMPQETDDYVEPGSGAHGTGDDSSCEQVGNQLVAAQESLGVNEEGMGSIKLVLEDRLDYQAARPQGWPARGRITSTYGYRRNPFGGNRKFHEGIDIAAPIGTPVVATAAGEVVFADRRGGYGLTVIIEHGFGFRTLYAHNSSLQVSPGDYVEAGVEIARVGSTGASTGPHLHYEVHYRGDPVDPADFLPRNIVVDP